MYKMYWKAANMRMATRRAASGQSGWSSSASWTPGQGWGYSSVRPEQTGAVHVQVDLEGGEEEDGDEEGGLRPERLVLLSVLDSWSRPGILFSEAKINESR